MATAASRSVPSFDDVVCPIVPVDKIDHMLNHNFAMSLTNPHASKMLKSEVPSLITLRPSTSDGAPLDLIKCRANSGAKLMRISWKQKRCQVDGGW